MGIIAVMWTLALRSADIKRNNGGNPGVVRLTHSSGRDTPIDLRKSPDRVVFGRDEPNAPGFAAGNLEVCNF
jgi:hypothetical protein